MMIPCECAWFWVIGTYPSIYKPKLLHFFLKVPVIQMRYMVAPFTFASTLLLRLMF